MMLKLEFPYLSGWVDEEKTKLMLSSTQLKLELILAIIHTMVLVTFVLIKLFVQATFVHFRPNIVLDNKQLWPNLPSQKHFFRLQNILCTFFVGLIFSCSDQNSKPKTKYELKINIVCLQIQLLIVLLMIIIEN